MEVSETVKTAKRLLKYVAADFWEQNLPNTSGLDLIVWRPIFTRGTLDTLFTTIEETNLGMDIGDGMAGEIADSRAEYCGPISDRFAVQHPGIVEKYGWTHVCAKPILLDETLLGVYAVYGKSPFTLNDEFEERLHQHLSSQLLLVDVTINTDVRDASLEKSLLALEVGKAAEDRFHDIKETLFSATGALGALKRNRNDRRSVERNVQIVLTQIEKAKEVAEKYIKEAKNPNRLYKTKFDLTTLTRSIVKDLDIRAKHRASQRSRKIDVHFSYPEQGIYINADIDRIARAIGNVIYNAEHWVIRTPGKIVRIDIDLTSDELFGYIKIRDTGPGIIEPKRALEKGYSLRDGTGLGLSIAKKVLELHDGSLRITSAPNQWTSIDLSIPLAD